MIQLSFLKILTSIFYMFTVLFCVSSNSLFFFWVLLELNMLFFIILNNNLSVFMVNSLMSYFILQSLTSNFILMGFVCFQINKMWMFEYEVLIFLCFWLKLGFFPFHSWYYQISENMCWDMWFLLNTFQKLVIIWGLSFYMLKIFFLQLMIMLNAFYSLFEVINQNSLRWMINSSSLNHYSWVLISMTYIGMIWEIYWLYYLFMSIVLLFLMKMKNLNSLFTLSVGGSLIFKLLVFIVMMSFLGVPPLAGFLPKFLVLLSVNNIFVLMLLLMVSLFSGFMYLVYSFSMIYNFCLSKIINEKNWFMYMFMISFTFLVNFMGFF
ncbi:NADH dehydrogenase subunit 2 (mitochondrion) [Galendromus occidentalis]|uniref:NADH-ubiquinone oxidoreductase chain 2 n=1 Tax=Galendromus occidentalis TaxID=34638 RepID=A0AAJ8C103_9ACAR|nr:NADH dehydrogenase subunit 2 [Galendromus occidentalis]